MTLEYFYLYYSIIKSALDMAEVKKLEASGKLTIRVFKSGLKILHVICYQCVLMIFYSANV